MVTAVAYYIISNGHPEFLLPFPLNLNVFHIIIVDQSVILLFLAVLFLAVVSAMLLYQNCLQT